MNLIRTTRKVFLTITLMFIITMQVPLAYSFQEPLAVYVVNETEKPVVYTVVTKRAISEKEQINAMIVSICKDYKMDPNLIKSVIYHESRFNPNAKTGQCLGLMQVSTIWHSDRAKRLGVTNFYDPYSNILLGVDYISELRSQHKDMRLVLMLYNMKHKTALAMYHNGDISWYAKSVIKKAESFKKGG